MKVKIDLRSFYVHLENLNLFNLIEKDKFNYEWINNKTQ